MNSVSAREAGGLFRRYGTPAWLELHRRFGRTFELQGNVFTIEPEAVRALLMDRPHTLRRSIQHRLISRITPGSPGLLFMEGDAWRQHLRAVTPALRKQHVDGFAGVIAHNIRCHAAAWAQMDSLPDLYQSISHMSVNDALRIGYGLDPKHPQVRELGRELVAYKLRTMSQQPEWRLDTVPFVPGPRRLATSLYSLVDLGRRVHRLRRMVGRVLADPSTRTVGPSWVEGLLRERVAFNPLVDEINHLYGAYNAVDYVVSCGLLELSRHPEERQRLRDELDGTLGDRPAPAHDDLPKLPRMWDFMREVLRLYPVAMCIFRHTGQPLAIDGDVVGAHRPVAILPYALHRTPDFWPEPETFDPGRWGGSAEPRVPFSYIPFLFGPRRCIGRDLAELEFATIVGTLLRGFDVEVLRTDAEVLPCVVPRFDRRLPFRVRRRR